MTAAVAGRAAAAARTATSTVPRVAAAPAAGGGGVPAGKTAPRPPSGPPSSPPAAQPTPPAPPAPAVRRRPSRRFTGRTGGWRPTAGGGARDVVNSGAGFLLALAFWGWIALPMLRGGPDEVRNIIRAKFLNKAPDGSWLP